MSNNSPMENLSLEAVLKPQIAFESPAYQRDFASICMKIIEFNKRWPIRRRPMMVAGLWRDK